MVAADTFQFATTALNQVSQFTETTEPCVRRGVRCWGGGIAAGVRHAVDHGADVIAVEPWVSDVQQPDGATDADHGIVEGTAPA